MVWHNRARRHSSIGRLTSVDCELQLEKNTIPATATHLIRQPNRGSGQVVTNHCASPASHRVWNVTTGPQPFGEFPYTVGTIFDSRSRQGRVGVSPVAGVPTTETDVTHCDTDH